MDFKNVYDDSFRADSYSQLEFPGTYYLAYRDIPEILKKNAAGKTALDFGCGTGRSTRFLKELGYETTGADISEGMLTKASESDPGGEYYNTSESGLGIFTGKNFDLITAVFTFDNIPGTENRAGLLKQLGGLLNSNGIIVLVDSTPEIYINEWLSFSTKDFPGNLEAKSGEKVKIIMSDVEDKRPVEDIIWFDIDYQDMFRAAGLNCMAAHKPLGYISEPFLWVNETTIAPWIIYVLKK